MQIQIKSNDPNATESVNISPELRSLAQPMLHDAFSRGILTGMASYNNHDLVGLSII